MSKKDPNEQRPKLPPIPAQTKVFSAPTVSIGLGLACILAWLKMTFMSPNVFGGFDETGKVLETTYFISLVTTVATLWLLCAFHVRASKLLGRGSTRVVLPICVALSTAGMALTGLDGGAGTFFMAATGVATGVFSACLNVIFGISLSLLPTKHTVAACSLGYVVADLVTVGHLFLEPLAALALCTAAAPVGMLLLSYGVKCFDFSKEDECDPLPPQLAPSDPAERKDLRTVQFTFAALLAAAGFSYELARMLLAELGALAPSDLVAQAVTTCAATLFVIGASLLILRRKRDEGPIGCYRVVLVLLALNAALLPAPLVYQGLSRGILLGIDHASFDCLGMLMWVLVTGICSQYPQSCFKIFAFTRAAWSTGPLAGALAGMCVCRLFDLSLELVFGISIACTALLLVAGNFVFSTSVMNKALNIMPTDARRRFVERCEAVIRDFGLTEREGEIMIMFAKGRNLPYVQQELCLSKGTVSTHRQHIYQKLNVHSAQEMIDLIQGYSVQTP